MKTKRPHLSSSQLRQFNKCEAQWYFRYVLGMKTIPSAFLTLGSSFDDALNYNFEQKIKTRLDLKTDIVIDVFNTSFKKRKDDTDFGVDKPDNIKDVGIKLVKVYQRVASPFIQPKLVQQPFEIDFANTEWSFVAIPDLITTNGIIIDNKTTARTPSGIVYDDMLQMRSYEITLAETGKPAPSKIIYSVKTAEPTVVALDLPQLTPQIRKHWEYITATTYQHQKLIRDNTLTPKTNRGHWLCSQRFCGYWKECEKLFGGKVKE